MEIKDIFFTPIVLLLIYFFAYWIRPKVTNQYTKKYFIPAVTLKLIGAIALGMIYQFYYPGGDTFNYYDQSQVIYQAFEDNPWKGLELIFSNGEYTASTYNYAQYMRWYQSPSEFFVVKASALLGLICGHTYSSIALYFAFFSFTGLWALYLTFLKIFPRMYKEFAITIFFVPSVFFWGSGLMKDTLTIGALGWLFYGFYSLFIAKDKMVTSVLIIICSFYTIYTIKIYILLSFLPPAIIWIVWENNNRIKSVFLRQSLKPLLLLMSLFLAYFTATRVTEGDTKYDLKNVGERTRINAEYLYRISLTQEGSAYYLGELDGSIESMIRIAPQAVFVTLFRPFLWEANNSLMLLAAIEAFCLTFLFISILIRPGPLKVLKYIATNPVLLFCLLFTLILSFAVGLNSFNFGTLVRYKIQILPFYLSGLFIIRYLSRQSQPKLSLQPN